MLGYLLEELCIPKFCFDVYPLIIPSTYGQSIYKCTDSSGKVNYQQTPCPDVGDAIINYKSRPIFTPRFSKNHITIKKSINEDKRYVQVFKITYQKMSA